MEGRFPDGSKIVKIEWSKRKKAVGRLSGVGAECSRVSRADREGSKRFPRRAVEQSHRRPAFTGSQPKRDQTVASSSPRCGRTRMSRTHRGGGYRHVSTVGVAVPTRIPGPEIDSLSQPFFPLPRDSARR